MRKHGVVTVAALLMLLLGGCSDSKDDTSGSRPDYCQTLKQTQADFEAFDFMGLSDKSFDELLNKADALERAASGETKKAWTTLSTALDELQSALAEANMSVSDLPMLAQGQVPDGVDAAKLPRVIDRIKGLSADPGIQKASDSIQRNAQSACHITLGATPSPADATAS